MTIFPAESLHVEAIFRRERNPEERLLSEERVHPAFREGDRDLRVDAPGVLSGALEPRIHDAVGQGVDLRQREMVAKPHISCNIPTFQPAPFSG